MESELNPSGNLALRYVNLGGEALEMHSLKPWFDRHGDQTPRLINLYGITETAVIVTYRPLSAADLNSGSVIGVPIPDLQVYILDAQRQPVPVGVPRDLHWRRGVGRGYLNREELTRSKFVPDPFSGHPDSVMYRSGDLARYLPTRDIEYFGRIDHQVKIRGFRIELGEIEAVIARHPAVKQCVVIVREDVPGDKQLVAYFETRPGSAPNVPELRAHIQKELPAYMVPSIFVGLEKLPLTHNGKVDRKALPLPTTERTAASATDFVGPRNEVEELLARIWINAFHLKQVGVHDNFFDLGGHSLLAVRIVNDIEAATKVRIPLTTLMQTRTIAGLAEVLRRDDRIGSALPIRPRAAQADGAGLPLSFAQEQQWFLNQLAPDSAAYNMVDVVPLGAAYNAEALRRTVQELVRRHEILRTAFVYTNGEPMQVVLPDIAVPLAEVDLSGLAGPEQEREWVRVVQEQGRKAFDLSQAPLFRGALVRWSSGEYRLLLTVHHIIADEWSMEVLHKEVTQLYKAFLEGRPSPLPELPIQYADFACWQRDWLQGAVLDQQLRYWTKELAGAPTVLELATDKQRPAVQSFRGATEVFQLPAALLAPLKSLGRQEQATLFMVLQASFMSFLHRYTGQEDILVSTPISRRTHAETETLIGYFLNTLILRAQFSGDQSFRELLRQIRERALGAYSHADLPFKHLVAELAPERDPSRTPLSQVMFILHDPDGTSEASKISGEHQLGTGTSKFDLTLIVSETEQGLEALFEYSTDLFEAETIRRMCRHYVTLLEAITEDPDRRVAALPVVTPEERQLLLTGWNNTATAYPANLCLHDAFEQQAERTPQAVAIEFDGKRSTYAELNGRANQLANHLREHGVGPDTLAGAFMERSLEMVVALYGVLKAGGAYVPLDPAFPQNRLAHMVEDSRMKVLLTHRDLSEKLPLLPPVVIRLDADAGRSPHAARPSRRPRSQPAEPAYVLYTSGSTGKPKGVEIPHSAIVNFLFSMQREPGFEPPGHPAGRHHAVLRHRRARNCTCRWLRAGKW